MDEIQGKNSPRPDAHLGGSGRGSRRFFVGVIFIIGSIAYGWAGLFACNALAIRYGRFWFVLGWIIYGISWITYGLGFILVGPSGVSYAKRFLKRLFLLQSKKR